MPPDEEMSCADRKNNVSVLAIGRAAQRAQLCGSYLDPRSPIRWFCFRVHLGRQGEAVSELTKQGFPVFFPLMRLRRPSGKIDVRPLFPRYGFVAFDVTKPGWRRVCSTFGVEAVLGSHPERPTPIPTGVIEGLLAQLTLSGWIDDPDLKPIDAPVAPGLLVKIKSGPFTSFHGVCRWSTSKRLAVLLDLFGGAREVVLPRGSIEIVAR
jgi:transcription antitermination factor NusG